MELRDDRPSEICKAKSRSKVAGTAENQCAQIIAQALVAAGDRAKRRARSQAWRVQTDECEENRGFAQTIRRTQFPSQDRCLSLGIIDVDLLHQSGRQELAEGPTRPAATREDGIEASVRARVIRDSVTWCER